MRVETAERCYLFESHEDLLPLAEVSEEEVQGSRHQRGVIMHGQVQQDPQEGPAPVVVQVQRAVLFAWTEAELKLAATLS